MYVVTNREINHRRSGLGVFGKTPNVAGPNELRVVEVTRQGADYQVELLKDRLTRTEVRELKQRHDLDIDDREEWFASLRVACELMARATREQRPLLIYLHGYNNDMKDVLATAEALEELYDVIVVPFSWPANGGGPISGTLAYLRDKQDARASMDALDRFLGKVALYHDLLTRTRRDRLWRQAVAEDDDRGNLEGVHARFSELLAQACEVKLNLMCHSMGNYVLKYALKPRAAAASTLIFDNVALVAADTNHDGHETWVERLQVRNRLYILINENDSALAWSRRKPGEAQRVRLGHYLRNLVARNACYIDVTQARGVGNSHGYFAGKPVEQNPALRNLFKDVFKGERAEEALVFASDLNVYRPA
jgi:esterase/lipase superfamily enzyme